MIAVLQDALAQQALTQAWDESTVRADRNTAPAARDSPVLIIALRLLTATEHLSLDLVGRRRSFSFNMDISLSGSCSRSDSCGSFKICCISLSSIFVHITLVV